jgi:hypothetical protein
LSLYGDIGEKIILQNLPNFGILGQKRQRSAGPKYYLPVL